MITKENLAARKAELVKQLQEHSNILLSINGAIQDVDYWLGVLQYQEEHTAKTELTGQEPQYTNALAQPETS